MATAMPGLTKDIQRHGWQKKSVLVLTGSLEVRRKCQETAWHVVNQDSKSGGHVIRTPGGGWLQEVS